MADEQYNNQAGAGSSAPRERAPRERRRIGCGFWLLVMGILFFGLTTLVLFLALVGVSGTRLASVSQGGLYTEAFVSGNKDSMDKILLLPIHGIILDGPAGGFGRVRTGIVRQVKDILKLARDDANIRAVLLDINSPGGGITASDVIYHEIEKFKSETGKPVVGLLRDVAASGGYYIAASAEEIVAHPTALTGSIGVIMPYWNIRDLLKKIGVRSEPIKSGQFKDMGSLARDITAEERRMLQGIVDEYLNLFVTVVHRGFTNRGVTITRKKLETYCDGRIFTAKQAMQSGFVDKLGYYEDAVSAVATKAGITPAGAHVVTYQRNPGLLDMLLMRSVSPMPDTLKLQIEGMPKFDTPRFMYLWTVGGGTGEK